MQHCPALLGLLLLLGCASRDHATPTDQGSGDQQATADRRETRPPPSEPPAFRGRLALDFDALALDTLPAGWRVEATNPGATQASWGVSPRPGGGAGRALVLRDTRGATGQTFNLCWSPEPSFRDGTLRVTLRAGSGVEDQGGGLAWRMRDAKNYYVVRWNPLEDNLRVYHVADGRRSQLASARVFTDPQAWHTLEVRHQDASIVCSFDGEELLAVDDTTFLAPGGVGLWTKADAATAFDDLVVEGR